MTAEQESRVICLRSPVTWPRQESTGSRLSSGISAKSLELCSLRQCRDENSY